jgi:hypothetical protein
MEKKREKNSESFRLHSRLTHSACAASLRRFHQWHSAHIEEEASERKEKILFNILDWHNNEAEEERRRNKTLANIHFARGSQWIRRGGEGKDGMKGKQHEYLNGMQNDFTILGTRRKSLLLGRGEDAPRGNNMNF